MRKKIQIYISLLVIMSGFFLTASCAKKAVQAEATAHEESTAAKEPAAIVDSDADVQKQTEPEIRQSQLAEQAAKDEEKESVYAVAAQTFMNEDIYFDFDTSSLGETAKDLLSQKAEWLRMNPDASVIIEGHCDERGTNAYNIALGDRRAESAKSYLVNLGIDAIQLSKISYGEERPIDMGKDEEAMAKNRRVHFVVE